MKKLTLFATALAAVFAASSCSSDDSLAELTTPQVEKGLPLKVVVTNNDEAGDDTRGVDITAINSYKMTAVYNTNDAWFKNVAFSKVDNVWTPAPEQYWSTDAGVTSAQFYAVSTDDGGTAVAAPTIGDDLTFSWTSSTAIADQKDLMIGRSVVIDGETKTPSAIDKGETVNLNFTHGLTKVVLKPYALCSTVAGNVSVPVEGATAWFNNNGGGMVGKIKSIEICNVPTDGTYDFSTGEWTPGTTFGNYVVFDAENVEDAINLQSCVTTKISDVSTNVTAVAHNPLYMIPQTLNSWTSHATKKGTDIVKLADKGVGQCYLKIRFAIGQLGDLFYDPADPDNYTDYDYSDIDFDDELVTNLGWDESALDNGDIDEEEAYKRAYYFFYVTEKGGKLGYNEAWTSERYVTWVLPQDQTGMKQLASSLDDLITDEGYVTGYLPLQSCSYNSGTSSYTYGNITLGVGKTLTLGLQFANILGEDGKTIYSGGVQFVSQ